MAGYIQELRELVGHRTIIQCAASVICVNEQGQILLGKRSDNHMWGYAGGGIEIDESVEDCAKRELYEEMGIVADNLELFYINSGPETHYIYPNGDEVSNVEIIYICRKWSGKITPQDGELEEIKFFEPEAVNLDEISPPIRPVLREYLSKTNNNN
ncbi:MAG: NUDIX domain-containing protein [Eubacterium sp.]|nr:NUDIX domain-containing protein [Eubacterium sp.]